MRWCGADCRRLHSRGGERAGDPAARARTAETARRHRGTRAGTIEQVQLMPRGSVYGAIIVIVVFATLVPSFAVACTRSRFRLLLAYVAGLACGTAVLIAERYLTNGIWWNEVFYVLLLPIVGMIAGAAWRSKKRPQLIASLVLVAGALYVVTMSALSLSAHVDVPFEAGNKGSVTEAEFSVATAKTYTFYLNLFFREGDRQNKERVRKLAGTGAYRDGRQIDTGLPIPVRLRVERIGNNGASSILDRTFTDHDREGMAADHFSKLITRIQLEPGRYRARVEALENIPELEDISVHFSLLVAHDRGGP